MSHLKVSDVHFLGPTLIFPRSSTVLHETAKSNQTATTIENPIGRFIVSVQQLMREEDRDQAQWAERLRRRVRSIEPMHVRVREPTNHSPSAMEAINYTVADFP